MAHTLRSLRFAALAVALALPAMPALASSAKPDNRGLDTEHAPVVSRTDYVLDLAATSIGLAPGEASRLGGWFDGLEIGYGDTITLDTSAVWHATASEDAINAIVASYGMLVSRDASPITASHPPSGRIRVVVSRAIATVPGCPDWSVGNTPTHNAATTSNFGCAYMTNIAAMVANPQDLVRGQRARPSGDAMLSVKAIKTFRDAPTTGANGLKNDSVRNVTAGGN